MQCAGAKCDDLLDAPDDEIDDTACDGVIFDLSGRRNEKVIGRLGDPIAKALQKSDRCPSSFQELREILDEATGTDCAVRTRVVSEEASTIGAFGSEAEAKSNASYRTVTNRQCQDEETFSVLFSQFGMGFDSETPKDYEAISFDEVDGVFNYYKLHGDGTFGWFGNSRDFLSGPGQEVAIGETVTSEKNCARCHKSGGLIMKELPAPWLHWQQSPLAGARDLVGKNENMFGAIAAGNTLESLVKRGNQRWNPHRIGHVRETGTVQDLLRPLFCTVEVNLDSAGDSIQNLIDDELSSVSLNNASSADYGVVRDENEQTMITGAQSSVTGPRHGQGQHVPHSRQRRHQVRRLAGVQGAHRRHHAQRRDDGRLYPPAVL